MKWWYFNYIKKGMNRVRDKYSATFIYIKMINIDALSLLWFQKYDICFILCELWSEGERSEITSHVHTQHIYILNSCYFFRRSRKKTWSINMWNSFFFIDLNQLVLWKELCRTGSFKSMHIFEELCCLVTY